MLVGTVGAVGVGAAAVGPAAAATKSISREIGLPPYNHLRKQLLY